MVQVAEKENESGHLVIDLLHRLGQMSLELVVGIGGLVDTLLQCRVRVVPRGPHVVGALRHQVVHVGTETLRGRAGACKWKSLFFKKMFHPRPLFHLSFTNEVSE